MNYPTLTKEKPDCVLLCVPQAGIFPYRSSKAMYYAVPKDCWRNDTKKPFLAIRNGFLDL